MSICRRWCSLPLWGGSRCARVTSFSLALLLLVSAVALAQTPSPAPSETPTYEVTILLVGDLSNVGMTNIEKRVQSYIVQNRRNQGLTGKQLPVIAYHINKPAEKRYCTQKLGIKPNELLLVGLVHHEKFVVKSILYRVVRVQVADTVAEQVMNRAVQVLADKGALNPQPTASPTAIPEAGRDPFIAYVKTMNQMAEAETRVQQRFTQAMELWRTGARTAEETRSAIETEVLPPWQDLMSRTENLPTGTQEVVRTHATFVEFMRHQLQAYLAWRDAVSVAGGSTEAAQRYGELAQSARERWSQEVSRIEQKYRNP